MFAHYLTFRIINWLCRFRKNAFCRPVASLEEQLQCHWRFGLFLVLEVLSSCSVPFLELLGSERTSNEDKLEIISVFTEWETLTNTWFQVNSFSCPTDFYITVINCDSCNVTMMIFFLDFFQERNCENQRFRAHNHFQAADYLVYLEMLAEDKTFAGQKEAALLASKVTYCLEQYDRALTLALAAGDRFSLSPKQSSNIAGNMDELVCVFEELLMLL